MEELKTDNICFQFTFSEISEVDITAGRNLGRGGAREVYSFLSPLNWFCWELPNKSFHQDILSPKYLTDTQVAKLSLSIQTAHESN